LLADSGSVLDPQTTADGLDSDEEDGCEPGLGDDDDDGSLRR
jgi:hypothetical protein